MNICICIYADLLVSVMTVSVTWFVCVCVYVCVCTYTCNVMYYVLHIHASVYAWMNTCLFIYEDYICVYTHTHTLPASCQFVDRFHDPVCVCVCTHL